MPSAADIFDVDGRTTVRSGDGVFFRVPLEAAAATAGTADTAQLTTKVRNELGERRLSGLQPLAGREHVTICAPDQLAGTLKQVLGAAGVAVDRAGEAAAGHPRGLLLHVPNAAAERRRFEHLPAAGTAVLRCYQEGELVLVDPLATGPQDPSASQVLRRRLAASPASAELTAWLDTPAATGFEVQGVAWTLVEARLLTMIRAWQSGSPALAALRRTLWRLDTRTLVATCHPVLPFPEPAPLASSSLVPRA